MCVRACVGTYVRFNSSKTARRTNMKLGTINYYLQLSVIRGNDIKSKKHLSKMPFSNVRKSF